MNRAESGGSAFPRPIGVDGVRHYNPSQKGMTLLDYFAGQALVGLIINSATVSVIVPITTRAYELAKYMIEARGEMLKEGE